MRPPKIALAGLGNLAYPLAKALRDCGYEFAFLQSSNPKKHSKLSAYCNCEAYSQLPEIKEETILFLTVSDVYIENWLAKNSISDHLILVHTAGSKNMDILSAYSKNFGVFYPLQSFTAESKPHFESVPIALEFSSEYVKKHLFELSNKLSQQIYFLNSSQRLHLHLAAVIANNFTNYLLGEAQNIAEEKDFDVALLYPLVQKTMDSFFKEHPEKHQTGPAIRKNERIIAAHESLLENKPHFKQIYTLISQAIKAKHHE